MASDEQEIPKGEGPTPPNDRIIPDYRKGLSPLEEADLMASHYLKRWGTTMGVTGNILPLPPDYHFTIMMNIIMKIAEIYKLEDNDKEFVVENIKRLGNNTIKIGSIPLIGGPTSDGYTNHLLKSLVKYMREKSPLMEKPMQ